MNYEDAVSVVVPTYNRSKSLGKCLNALLEQSHRNLEVIVCDDGSSDDTITVVKGLILSDARIRLIQSPTNSGPAVARNRAIREARGKYVFFTDDDVLVPPVWISTGLRIFKSTGCVGVEGKVVYVSDTYRPRYSDRHVGNVSGNNYMMANMAYKKDVLFQAGLLNEAFRVMEDRDLALRVLEYGSIVFAENFRATHMREKRTVKSFFREARGAASWVQFDIINNQRNQMAWCIYRPLKLLTLVFPPLIFGAFFTARFRTPFDYLLLLLLYPRLWYERVLVWKWAIRYRKLVI